MPSADHACARCRDKKIRCGREKEQCVNCRRDGAECEYKSPRRVNHVKLLCSKVSILQDRLDLIEKQLSTVIQLATNGNSRQLTPSAGADCLSGIPDPQQSTGCEVRGQEANRKVDGHIFRDSNCQTHRYHGPGTLLSLCNRFRRAVTRPLLSLLEGSNPTNNGNAGDNSDDDNDDEDNESSSDSPGCQVIKQHLSHLSWEAGKEASDSSARSDKFSIRLPAKQLVLMVQGQFFQHCPWASEVFCQHRFLENVKNVYSRPFVEEDEPWALCLHTITLLVLGPEVLMQDHSPSGFRAWHAILANYPCALSGPKLINLQTLILLTKFAQQYFPLSLAELLHSQACVLAKTMGLHRMSRHNRLGLSVEEAEEHLRVFRSLYVQDMGLAIARGSNCWLPDVDCAPVCQLSQDNNIGQGQVARVQLAQIQEALCRSEDAKLFDQSQYQRSLVHADEQLTTWAVDHHVCTPASLCSVSTMDLQQDFLATRIAALSRSSCPEHHRHAICDSRIACALLLVGCNACDRSVADRLAPLEPQRLPASHPLIRLQSKSPDFSLYPDTKSTGLNDIAPLRRQAILEQFPISAFFILATEIATSKSSDPETDLELLQRLCLLYSDLGEKLPVNSHIQKLKQVFQIVLDTACLLYGPKSGPLGPGFTAQDTTNSCIQTYHDPRQLTTARHMALPNRDCPIQMSLSNAALLSSISMDNLQSDSLRPLSMPASDMEQSSPNRWLIDQGALNMDLSDDTERASCHNTADPMSAMLEFRPPGDDVLSLLDWKNRDK